MNRSGVFLAFLALLSVPFLLRALPTLASGEGGFNGALVSPTHIKTPFDNVPRFCDQPTVTSSTSGLWSSSATWSANQVPGPDAKVLIAPGHTVRYNSTSATPITCIEIQGTLDFQPNSSLLITDLDVHPAGALIIGAPAKPISANQTVTIAFRDVALNTTRDPAQYGNGLRAWGKVAMYGVPLDPTFVRLAQEPKAGDTILALESAPTGWGIGNTLILPDTRQMPDNRGGKYLPGFSFNSQAEERTIAGINGTTLTLSSPLQYDHRGARRADGTPETGWLPHVGNLARNVRLFSENPGGTRGHVQNFHRAVVDIRYAEFADLGRTTVAPIDRTTFNPDGTVAQIGTNQIGRYPLHMHHVWGPLNGSAPVYQLLGNVVRNSQKWGITIHDSHYGDIRQNIVYDTDGSGIVTEDGNESFNTFEENFVIGGKPGDSLMHTLNLSEHAGIRDRGNDNGWDNSGLWFRGPKNYVRKNVVTNVTSVGVNYNGYYLLQGFLRFPNFPGADLTVAGQYSQSLDNIPVLESGDNEVYGSTSGFWASWYAGSQGGIGAYKNEGIFSRYRLWNTGQYGAYTYHVSRMTFDDWVMRGDAVASALDEGGSRVNEGFFMKEASYENGLMVLRNPDIQGFNTGVNLPHRPVDVTIGGPNIVRLEGGFLSNHVNIEEAMPGFYDDRRETADKMTEIRDVRFAHTGTRGVPGQPVLPLDIWMAWGAHTAPAPTQLSRTFVYNFNGHPNENYQVYFDTQHPDFVVPQNPDSRLGCPVANLTNQQCWDQYSIAMAGAVAPCRANDGDNCEAALARARALNIDKGLVFALTGAPPPPPSFPPKLTITQPTAGSSIASSTVNVTYSKSGDLTGVDHVHFQLDGDPEVRDLDFDGMVTLSNVSRGSHTLKGYLAKADHSKVSGTDVTVSFSTTVPPISNVAPTITTSQDAFEVVVGQLLSFTVTATDADGDPITLDALNLSTLFPGGAFQ